MLKLEKSKQALKAFLPVLLVSALLMAYLFQHEQLLLSSSLLGGPGHIAYQILFWFLMPLRIILMYVIPQNGHNWSVLHYLVLSVTLPLYVGSFWWGCRSLADRLRRRARAWRPLPGSSPTATQGPSLVPVGAGRPGPLLQPVRLELPGADLSGEELIMDRRVFLLSTAMGGAGLAAGGVATYSSVLEPGRLRVREYSVKIKDLPAEFHGLRLVHVSDTHYGPFVSMNFLEEAFEAANRLKGDMVILTGDYMHRTPRSLEPGIKALASLRARLGAVAVLGNHDHWEGANHCRRVFAKIGVPLVDNHRLFLTPDGLKAKAYLGNSICMAGVGDVWEDEVSFVKAVGGVHERIPRLVLAHNPDAAEMLEPGCRVDLMLSGHTHGGQVKLPLIGMPFKVTKYGHKYLGGLCHGPGCPVVVSRGVGMSGLPIRLGVPPELVVVTLHQA